MAKKPTAKASDHVRARDKGEVVPVQVELDAALAAAMDKARGKLKKRAFIETAIEEALERRGFWPPSK